MEMRSRVRLSSSWDAHGDLAAVLYIMSSSGSLLDEPLSKEQNTTPLSLCAPTSDPSQSCQLHVDLSNLCGYSSSQLELTSTSRTTELYLDEDDYVGTVRGSVAGKFDTDGTVQKLYSCSHSLPSDSPHARLTIKLLSLQGKREVLIDRIQLVVTADHGGSTTQPFPEKRVFSGGPLDMQQLLGSLPVDGMPPFMQTLVSSLSHLSSQVTSGSASRNTTDGDRPAELSQLMQTLRQLRPPSVHTDLNGTRENGETTTGMDGREADAAMNGVEGKEMGEEEEGLAAMEARLKLYIDEKFEQLERRLEKKVEELFSSRLQHHETFNCRPLHLVQDDNLD